MSSPEVLDLSLAPYAVLVGRAGVDPDAEVRRFDGSDPDAVYGAAKAWSTAGRGMEEAWTSSWAAQARLAAAYTNDGSPVYDRAAHEAMLPVGFRDAGAQLGQTGHRLGAVATSLDWESAMARSRLEDLHGEIGVRAREWAARVAEAGLIPADQADAWRAERDRVEQVIVSMIVDAHTSVRGNVTRYEGVIGSALAGLAEQGFAEDPAGAVGGPGAPAGDPVVLAGLGTPVHAGYAADPVNTGLGNFVEVETDLPFTGLTAGLSWSRTYNSRARPGPGPQGPRWACWASARLRADTSAGYYVGPDGRELTVPRRADGSFARVPDLSGRVLPGPDGGLVLAWNDGRRWSFGADGRPRSTEHGPGTEVGFVHDEHGRLVELVHGGGRRVTLAWGGLSIIAVTSSDGRAATYRYDDAGHLTGADAPGGARRYGIDVDGLIASVTDADGVVEVANTYDDDGRVLRQVSPHGRTVTFAYDAGRTTVADESGGPVNTYDHDHAGRLVAVTDGEGATAQREYDRWGNAIRMVGRGGAVTREEFDERGRVVRRRPPGGAEARFVWDDDDRIVEVAAVPAVADEPTATTRFDYRGAERVPTEIIDPEGGVTRFEVVDGGVREVVDPDGVRTRHTLDTSGLVVAVHRADGTTGRIERDAAGRVVAAVSPSGRREGLRYDRRGSLIERRKPDGAVWRYEYSAAGRCTATVDPSGARTEVRYGGHGDVAEVVDPSGVVTGHEHDTFGNVVSVTVGDGARWSYARDALSRLTAITDPTSGVWQREYDVEGRLVGTVDPIGIHRTAAVDAAGQIVGVDDGTTGSTFAHDGLGRTTAHARPDGASLTATYDRCGRRLTETGPDGGTTRYTWSPAGRLLAVTSPEGRTESYGYDGCGRVDTVTDGAGAVWALRRDEDGAVVERRTPAGAWERLHRDRAGRVVRRETSTGLVTTWTYDPAGRITAVDSPLAGLRRFTHDPGGRVVAATDALGHTTGYERDRCGRLVAVTDPLGGVTRRTHDAAGRVLTETDPLGNTTRFGYDAAGHLVARTDATGATVRWELDRSARVSAVTGDGPTDRIGIERDPLGRPVRLTEPGHVPDELGYDISGRLIRRGRGEQAMTWGHDRDGQRSTLGYPDGTSVGSERDGAGRTTALRHPLLGSLRLPRDLDGRQTGIPGVDPGTSTRNTTGRISGRVIRGQATRYGYDPAGQLVTAADRAGARTYAYDPCGRLVHESGPAGERRFTYDTAGRLQTAGDRAYRHDAAGRRTGETGPDHDRTYRYDWLGRPSRIDTRTPDGATRSTRLRVDGLGELAEVDDTPLMWDTADPLSPVTRIGQHSVISHDRRPLAMLDSTHPGRPPATTSGATALRDPWGSAGAGLALGEQGEVTVDGLVWLRHRTYDPATRGFTSVDPLPAIPGTPYAGNPYHYAANDPVNRSDPLGLRPLTDPEMQDDPGLFGAIGNWWDDNWEYVAAGGMAALGVGLMFTGVGGVAGVGLMAASGALLAGAGSTAVQRFENGAGGVDWNQVRGDAAVGGLSGLVGGGAGVALSRVGGLAALPGGVVTQGVAVGGLSSVPAGMVGRGLTGGDPLSATGIAGDLLLGGAAGGVTARLGGIPTAAPEPASPVGLAADAPVVNLPERRSPNPMNPNSADDRWNEFLGPQPHSDLHPRTGLPDFDRIVSADGTRAIRMGEHEMNSPWNLAHYHEETWAYDPDRYEWVVDNLMQRVQVRRGSW